MTFGFGQFTLDDTRAELKKNGRAIAIEPKALKLLLYLVRHRDRVVAKDELAVEIWPGTVVAPGSLTYGIRVIRRALGESASSQKVIRTLRGIGYRFVAPVETVKEAVPDRETASRSTPPVNVAVRFILAQAIDGEVGREIVTRSRYLAGELARRLGGRAEGKDLYRFTDTARALSFADELRSAVAPRGSLHPDFAIGIHAAMHDETRTHLAAQFAEKASAQSVLVSREVKLLANDHRIDSLVSRRTSSRGQRFSLYEFRGQRVQPSVEEALRGEPPLVGRERDLARAEEVLRAARNGHGACLLLAGEPGIGKTRLTGEIRLSAAGLGMTILQGACFERGVELPYAPFVQALAPLIDQLSDSELRRLLGDDVGWLASVVPELTARLPKAPRSPSVTAEQERHLILAAVAAFLARTAERTPTLLVLEDLHWADHSTVHLLSHLVRQLGETSIVVLTTYRDAEIGSEHPLAPMLAECERLAHCEFRPLTGLDTAAVTRLMSTLSSSPPPSALAEAISRETEGNPLFVRELLKVLHSENRLFQSDGTWQNTPGVLGHDLPHTVQSVIDRRLDQLSAPSRLAMRAAAVIGRRWSYDVLRRLAGFSHEGLLTAIDEAEQARLIEGHREGREVVYIFAHELIWRALYEGSNLARRQDLHRTIAEALEQKYGPQVEAHATELAAHYRAAGSLIDPGRAARFMTLAGDAAMRGSAYDEAARWYSDAADLCDGNSPEQAALLFKRGDALNRAGRRQEAERYLERAIEMYERLGRRTELEEAYFALMSLHAWQGQFDQMVVALQSGLGVAPASSSRARCLLQSAAGKWLTFKREPVAAARAMEEALRIARHIGDEALIGNVLATRGGNQWIYTEFSQSAATLAEAAAQLEAVGDSTGLLLSEIDRVIALGYLGRLAEMTAALDRIEPLLERFGDPGHVATFHLARGILAYVQGNLGDAHRLTKVAVAGARSGAMVVLPSALILLASIEFALGSWQQIEAHLTEADSLNQVMGTPPARYAGRLIPMVLRAFWDEERAVSDLKALLPTAPKNGTPLACDEFDAMIVATEAAVLAGAGALVVTYYEPLRRMADRGAVMGSVFYPLLARALGMLATAAGNENAAREHFRVALAQSEKLGARTERAQTLYHLALAGRSFGRDEEARVHAEMAARAFDDLMMPRHRNRAERIMESARGRRTV